MMMTGADPDRGSETSEFSDCSDIVGTPGVIPFTWEEHPGRPKGPGENIFESVLSRAVSRREIMHDSTSSWPRDAVDIGIETSSSNDDSPDAHIMKLNLRASLMGVHILDDETEMFFSRQVSNASSNTNSNGTPFRSAGAIPFKWEVEPGRPFQAIAQGESSRGPLVPPPGSRPVSGALYPGQFASRPSSGLLYYGQFGGSRPTSGALYSGQLDLGPDAQSGGGSHLTEKLFKKLVGQTRIASNTTSTTQADGFSSKKAKEEGESSTETLDRHFGHYSADFGYEEDDSLSPTSTLDHHGSESSPSSSERFYPSRNSNLTRYMDHSTTPVRRPSSQLAQCLLSLTAMADDTTDEDDIIFEQPSTSAPLWHPQVQPVEPHGDWPIVQYVEPTIPRHGHPKSGTNSPTRTFERWSSNSSSWNLSLISNPKVTVAKVITRSSGKKGKGHLSAVSNGAILREFHGGASTSTVLTYDRSGDVFGRHKWERDSSGSLPSVEELGFEAYDRPGEMVHTLDEEDFPFSPIASSFVFGEHNNSVEFSQRGMRSGIPRAVGPIVQEFTSAKFDVLEFRDSISNTSEESLTYSLEGGILQPEQDWVPTKSFHYIKGQNIEIVELGCSSRVFNGYIEINHSGRFSIDLQRGPRLERHRSTRYNIEKTPDVLLRIVKQANTINQKKRSNAKYGCFSQCRCLPVPKKGFLGRCLTSNQRPRLAVANSFESRLGSRSLGSVSAKNPTGPFQFF